MSANNRAAVAGSHMGSGGDATDLSSMLSEFGLEDGWEPPQEKEPLRYIRAPAKGPASDAYNRMLDRLEVADDDRDVGDVICKKVKLGGFVAESHNESYVVLKRIMEEGGKGGYIAIPQLSPHVINTLKDMQRLGSGGSKTAYSVGQFNRDYVVMLPNTDGWQLPTSYWPLMVANEVFESKLLTEQGLKTCESVAAWLYFENGEAPPLPIFLSKSFDRLLETQGLSIIDIKNTRSGASGGGYFTNYAEMMNGGIGGLKKWKQLVGRDFLRTDIRVFYNLGLSGSGDTVNYAYDLKSHQLRLFPFDFGFKGTCSAHKRQQKEKDDAYEFKLFARKILDEAVATFMVIECKRLGVPYSSKDEDTLTRLVFTNLLGGF